MKWRLALALFVACSACGGSGGSGVVKIGGPSFEPRRVAIRTLEPGPSPTPTPQPTPTPTLGPTPTPVPPPAGATLTAASGTQEGAPNSFCWSDQVGGPAHCYQHAAGSQASAIEVKAKETVLLRIDARLSPDDEAVRPFQGSRAGYPSQSIDPALETDLTVDLPKGVWSMDLCATWHGRGEPICWFFEIDVT